LGAGLDTQAFYELPALRDLTEHLELTTCRAVVEFGCGTGRLAGDLFETWLPPEATYLGLDISDTMVSLTKRRVARYGRRAEVMQSDGAPCIDRQNGSFDRFVCSYVLDLLPADEIRLMLREAHRVLTPGGLLGVVNATKGTTPASALVSTVWRGIHSVSPWLVGGCRPIEIAHSIPPAEWGLEYRNVVTPFAIPSEIVVARKLVVSGAPVLTEAETYVSPH
jgi:SAM-dependent methyltransferase